MKVEIWSDVVCPFCYIGKRHFEKALEMFEQKENNEVEWKSYQLDPNYVYNPNKPESSLEHLAEKKGITIEQTRQLIEHVVSMAAKVGLNYNYDKIIVANTTDAHKIIQLAKSKGLGDRAEELLFEAYFIRGENINERETLEKTALEIGLTKEDITEAFESDKYAHEITKDIQEGRQIGGRGGPFFVFDRKYAVSGAQPIDTFEKTIAKAYEDWESKNRTISTVNGIDGSTCDIDGNC